MASSSSISNVETEVISPREPKRKKAREVGTENHNEQVKLYRSRWRTPTEQQIYATKLVEALRHYRRVSNNEATPAASSITTRETADRVLAVAAKGRTRWSRAILTNRLSLKMKRINNKHPKRKKSRLTGIIRSMKPAVKKRLPALQKKVRVLGRLVPGCCKLSFPNLLDETADYIAALKMQVRAMTALTGLLSSATAS